MSNDSQSPASFKLKGIYVLDEDFEKGGDDLLFSNAGFLNELRSKKLLEYTEWPEPARASYYVDILRYELKYDDLHHYLHELYPLHIILDITRKGLVEMGAVKHVALFDRLLSRMSELGEDKLQAWVNYEHNDDAFETSLRELTSEFKALDDSESLLDVSLTWLIGHPELNVVSKAQWDEKILELQEQVPDMEQRTTGELE